MLQKKPEIILGCEGTYLGIKTTLKIAVLKLFEYTCKKNYRSRYWRYSDKKNISTRPVNRNFKGQGSFHGVFTSINKHLHPPKKGPAEKNFQFFLTETLQTALQMRNLTHRLPQSGNFFPKLVHFFLISEKGQDTHPLSTL